MAIRYSFKTDGNILLVKASGFDESLEDVMKYGAAVIEECARQNAAKVLCDELELEYRLGTLDIFKSAKFIAESAPSVARVAIVCNPAFAEDASFWETVATNRGLNVQIYGRGAGLAWDEIRRSARRM